MIVVLKAVQKSLEKQTNTSQSCDKHTLKFDLKELSKWLADGQNYVTLLFTISITLTFKWLQKYHSVNLHVGTKVTVIVEFAIIGQTYCQ